MLLAYMRRYQSYVVTLKTPPPLKAAQTVAVEDRPAVAAEYMGKAARLYVRTKNFDSAVSSLSLRILDLPAPTDRCIEVRGGLQARGLDHGWRGPGRAGVVWGGGTGLD